MHEGVLTHQPICVDVAVEEILGEYLLLALSLVVSLFQSLLLLLVTWLCVQANGRTTRI